MTAVPSPARVRGPLRLAAAIMLVGVLAVWLVKPIGDACPDLGRLPQGSTASSSPSLSPPLTRTCTYTAAGGTQARSRYVPWLDWIVLVLLAGLAGAAASVASPAGRHARARGREGSARERRPAGAPRGERERPGPRGEGGERDAAARERARRERAERARARRDR